MSKHFLPKVVLIIMLICMICATTAVVVAEPDVAKVATATEPNSSVKIMHITDIHYIPEYYCYQGANKENDFATKIKGDPKLMLESYAILERTVEMIKAEKDVPDYVFLTGDITSNGERQSLIDVANAMRKLQNEMRAKNPRFQILVVPGNHDVFNDRHASFYNTADGKKVPAPYASRDQFVKIFASLGYPDLSDTDAKAFYDAIPREPWEKDYFMVDGKHLPYENDGETAFVNSTTAEGLQFEYYSEGMDAAGRNGLGGLTYLLKDEARNTVVFGFDSTLSVEHNQKTEGEYTKANLDWFKEKVKGYDGYTKIALGHHNIVPHFTVQEKYLAAFVTYGWEEVAEILASNGVQYSFTGHLHANDVESYVSFNNNTIYDIETGATISEGAAIRNIRIDDFGDGKQNLVSELLPVDTADFSYLINKNLIPSGYEACFNGNTVDVQKYIYAKLFEPYLVNMIDSFISENKIYAKINSLEPKEIAGVTLDIKELVYVLLDALNKDTLKDYTYQGEFDSLKKEDNKFIGYVHELLSDAITMEVADGKSFNDLVLFAYGAHLMGAEAKSYDELPTWVKDALDGFTTGDSMGKVIDKLLFSEKGLYKLIDSFAKTPIDLTRSTNNLDALNLLVSTLNLDVNLKSVTLDDLVPKALNTTLVQKLVKGFTIEGDSLMAFVDKFLDEFLTIEIENGIGGVLATIAESFAVDATSYDGAFNETITYKVNADDAYSIMGDGKAIIENTRNNGRLPSELTITAGTNPQTTRNFVWFTSHFAPHADLEYRVDGVGEWTRVEATSTMLPYNFTLTDFGIFSSKVDKNIMRHNVRLTGLTASTKYEYRIGDSVRNVWLEAGKFETAASDKTNFEMAILSDLQGMDIRHYNDVATALNKFKGNTSASYAINLGDIVGDGKNSDQWKYALDIPSEFWKNMTSIVVAGNRDSKTIKTENKPGKKFVDNAVIAKMEYNSLAFHYDLGGTKLDGKRYYSFDVNGVHFIVLDNNEVDKNNKLPIAQYNWLKGDLTANAGKHIVVCMHKGIFTNGVHSDDKDTLAMREQLAPLFYENKVDLVLSGHDNLYSETPRINGEGVAAEDGVKYVNVAGILSNDVTNKMDDVMVKVDRKERLGMTMGVLKYDATADKLDYQGYAYDGENIVKVEDYLVVDETPEPPAKKDNKALIISLSVVGGVLVVGGIVTAVVLIMKKKKATKPSSNDDNSSDKE